MDTPFEAFNKRIGLLPEEPVHGPIPKTLFICGAPRSGTTIVCQSLAYCGDVGYIDNLIARFATNPSLGVLLSKAIDLPKEFTGKSSFGRTENLSEPHEFGLGWLNLLKLDDMAQPTGGATLDNGSLQSLKNLAHSFAQPVIFKSFAYLWFIDEIAKAMPDSCWLHVTRDAHETAKSLEKLYGLRTTDGVAPQWTSAVMQKTMDKASDWPLEQRTLAQVNDINQHITQCFDRLDARRKLSVALDDYKHDPASITRHILSYFDIPFDEKSLEVLDRC